MVGEQVELGDVVRDTIAGFTGVAVAKTEWLNGCWRITLQPQELKDGKPIDSLQFDVEQLELVESRAVAPKAPEVRTGGPQPDATRPTAPTR